MRTYLVGGAVRDTLLGLEPKDRDYVVVGATPAEMIAHGFTQVGADFPVFLHPVTREEYALARTERKTGAGYGGFEVETDGVTLEMDLRRRDLTINSMAISMDNGALIDPFFGQADLREKTLRATSVHFREDPLRVVRLARFSARFSDFDLDPFTQKMCTDLVKAGALDELSTERFWAELDKLFMGGGKVERFFHCLDLFKALEQVRFFGSLFGTDANRLDAVTIGRVAAACTRPEVPPLVRTIIFTALVSPKGDYRVAGESSAVTTLRALITYATADGTDLSRAADVEELIRRARATSIVSPAFEDLLLALAVTEGLGFEPAIYPRVLLACEQAAAKVKADRFPDLPPGKVLGEAIKKARIAEIEKVLTGVL